MLKGIKIKQNATKPEPYYEKVNITELLQESENNLTAQKKWKKEKVLSEEKKSEPTQEAPKQIQIIKNEEIKIEQLKDLSQKLWSSFVQHDVKSASETYIALKAKHEKYLEYAFNKDKYVIDSTRPLEFEKSNKNDEDYKESAFSKNMMQIYIEEKRRDNSSIMNEEFVRQIGKISKSEDYEDDKLDKGEKTTEEKQKTKKELKFDEKLERKNKIAAKKSENRNNRILSNCRFCFSNKKIQSESVIYIGANLYITLSNAIKFNDHYLVIPMEHYSSTMEMEDEIFEEFQEIKKKFRDTYEKEQKKMIFFEYSINLNKLPHLAIECLAIPKELLSEAQMYFKKYLVETEGDWTTHKKIIEIKSDTNIKKKIPKNFPYFYVDFNMEFGYAHIVEKEKSFNSNMHMEIMESLLNDEENQMNVNDIEEAKKRFKKICSF